MLKVVGNQLALLEVKILGGLLPEYRECSVYSSKSDSTIAGGFGLRFGGLATRSWASSFDMNGNSFSHSFSVYCIVSHNGSIGFREIRIYLVRSDEVQSVQPCEQLTSRRLDASVSLSTVLNYFYRPKAVIHEWNRIPLS